MQQSIAPRGTGTRAAFVPEQLETRLFMSAGPWGRSWSPPSTPITVTAAPAAPVRPAGCGRFATVVPTVQTVAYGTLDGVYQSGLQALAQGVAIPADQAVTITLVNGAQVSFSTVVVVDGVPGKIAVDANGEWLEGKVQVGATPDEVQEVFKALNGDVALPSEQIVKVSVGKDKVVQFTTTVATGKATVDITGAVVDKPGGGGGCGGGFGGRGGRR